VYPIYLDAKVPYGAGRRVARSSALWWPVASDIANACGQLGLQVFLEHDKTHPRDWENPGRVRILWKRNGRPMNAKITTSECGAASSALVRRLMSVRREEAARGARRWRSTYETGSCPA
jgi:signal recognition particle subunit SEC65